MLDSGFRRTKALTLSLTLVGWSFVGPRIPKPWRAPVQAGLGGLLVMVTRAPLGLRPPRVRAGLRLGLPVGAAAATGVLAATSIPAVRLSMAERELPRSAAAWLMWRIPLGTVWAEEAAFRAVLATVAADAFSPSGGRLLQAVAFGLFHIADARGAGEPVAPTVLATGIAGWLFSWLTDRSGSLAAPMSVHLAINEAGAAGALFAASRT